ncbi:MAG: 3'-5' exoribonuclease YhaM family protein [Acidobacteriota bacterium]
MSRLPRIHDLALDSEGWGYFLCIFKELRPIRSGELLLMTLQDATGQVTAKMFDEVARYKDEFDAGEFVRLDARVTMFQGQLQLVVSQIRRVHAAQDRAQGFREEDCVLSAPRPIDEMWLELTTHLSSVRDPHLRTLLNRLVSDNEAPLREWPAARSVHHAYRGGLLEHCLKMADVGRFLAKAYGASEDLVLAGVLLHDIGKLVELEYAAGTATYSRDGNLIGHIGLGLILVREAINGISGFPDDLRAAVEHLIVSHHGTREHGSPVEPRTVEAFILAATDELDARLHEVRRAIHEDQTDAEFTAWHKRLGRAFYKGGR